MFARGWAEREVGACLTRVEFQSRERESSRALLHSKDYLSLMNCTLKNDKDGKFCVFHHKLKEIKLHEFVMGRT